MKVVCLSQRVVTTGAGERRDCLDQRWATLLEPMGCLPLPLPNRLTGVEVCLEALDPALVVLTGGNDLASLAAARDPAPERDALEHSLLDRCGRRNIPVLGVCRGMQILAAHHGASLLPVAGHAGSRHAVMVEGTVPPWWRRGDITVDSYHDYSLDWRGLPPAIQVWARSEDRQIEAITISGRPQVGVMWHPEREPDLDSGRDLIRALLKEAKP